MWVGINYPWRDYGWDFGVPPPPWGERARWRTVIRSHLAEFRRVGLRAVRWFIVADGLLYGTGSRAPSRDSSGRWRFSPPRVSAEMLEDFSALLDVFHESGLLLVPVLLDFHFAKDAVVHGGLSGYVSGGRASVFGDVSLRRTLLSNLLVPLLEQSQRRPTAIYAWDLFNEPEGCTNTGASDRGEFPKIDVSDMVAFLREGLRCIRDYGFAATVGYRRPVTALRWPALLAHRRRRGSMTMPPTASPGGLRPFGESFWQFHYYADSLAPPGFPARADIGRERDAVILGEFATMPGHDSWPGLSDQSIAGRLAFAQDRGIALAMPWSFRARLRAEDHWEGPEAAAAAGSDDRGAAIDWPPVADELLRFTGGPPEPPPR